MTRTKMMKDLYASKSKQWYADTQKVTKYNLSLSIADLIELLKDEFGVIWEGPTNRKAPIQKAIQLLEHPENSENLEQSEDGTNKTVSEIKVQQTIDAVDASLQVVKEVSKKVAKAELKLQKRLELERQPAEVRWESDFMGEVTIGKEVREFWVDEPYQNPVINLVTSNGTVILSVWDSTKDNPFMRAAVREFHELIGSRGDTSLIENRLMIIAMQLLGSKKRADWYTQSHEELVLKDGERMEWKSGGHSFYVPEFFESFDFSQATAYKKAQHCSRKYSHRYEYVEGFALFNQKLFHHAWIKDKTDGKAVDVTFNEPEIQLFGIVLDIKWVDRVIASRLKNDTISLCFSHSVIDGNFLDDFALLKSGVTPTW